MNILAIPTVFIISTVRALSNIYSANQISLYGKYECTLTMYPGRF